MVTRYCWNAHNEQGDCSFSGHSHNVDFPWETADIYCQFWALFQNGPFSYLSAKRLGSREWRNIQDLSSYFPQKKEYQGVANFTFTFILLFSAKERIPGGGHFHFHIYPLVSPRRKNTRGWPLPSWSTSRTSTTTADTWLVEFFQPAKLARVLRTPGRSKCSVSKRKWSPLSEKSTFGSKTNQRTIFPSDAPQVSLRLGASLDPDNLRTGAWSFLIAVIWVGFYKILSFAFTTKEPKQEMRKKIMMKVTRKHVPRKWCVFWVRRESQPDSPQADLAP